MINGNNIDWGNTEEYYEVDCQPPNDNGYRVLVLTENGKLYIATGEYKGYMGHTYIKVSGYDNDILKSEIIAWQSIWLPEEFVWQEILRYCKPEDEFLYLYKKQFDKLMETRS